MKDNQMQFTTDIVIGLEVHAGLNTKTKLFCGCPNRKAEQPNTLICPVCLGHPGSKPVVNRKVIEYALRMGIATQSKLASELIFSRKSYFYPDLAKNYQITQYELPICSGGKLALKDGKEVGFIRIHLEEDPASLVHQGSMQESPFVLVDYNRSGSPLLEIVTKPCMASPEEARDFMKQLITTLGYLNIFDANDGIIKADANLSIRESGYTRVEIKNITGFKEIERALIYEVARQKQEINDGKNRVQETRGWDADKGITFSMRTKETEADYGYIIDPDLVPITITKEMIEEVRMRMPELAPQKIQRYAGLGVDRTDAEIVASELELAELFERALEEGIKPVFAARWIRRELLRVLNYNKKSITDAKVDERQLFTLFRLVSGKKITEKTGQRLIEKLMDASFDMQEYVEKEGLLAVSDSGQLEQWCREAIAESTKAVEDYKNGSEKSLNFIVGHVMQKSRGTAAPEEVKGMLRNLLRNTSAL